MFLVEKCRETFPYFSWRFFTHFENFQKLQKEKNLLPFFLLRSNWTNWITFTWTSSVKGFRSFFVFFALQKRNFAFPCRSLFFPFSTFVYLKSTNCKLESWMNLFKHLHYLSTLETGETEVSFEGNSNETTTIYSQRKRNHQFPLQFLFFSTISERKSKFSVWNARENPRKICEKYAKNLQNFVLILRSFCLKKLFSPNSTI